MLFERYEKMTHRERAMLDGKLITYHFYVAFVTLSLLSAVGLVRGDPHAILPLFMAAMSGGIGAALHIVHRSMIKRPPAESEHYLAAVSAVLGCYGLPLVPLLFAGVTLLSIIFATLYIFFL
jgi:hypothetical protein